MSNETPKWAVGQRVLLSTGANYARQERVAIVERLTPSGKVKVAGHDGLFRPDGWTSRRDTWSYERITPLADGDVGRLRLKATRNRIGALADELCKRRDQVVTPENAAEIEAFLMALLKQPASTGGNE